MSSSYSKVILAGSISWLSSFVFRLRNMDLRTINEDSKNVRVKIFACVVMILINLPYNNIALSWCNRRRIVAGAHLWHPSFNCKTWIIRGLCTFYLIPTNCLPPLFSRTGGVTHFHPTSRYSLSQISFKVVANEFMTNDYHETWA